MIISNIKRFVIRQYENLTLNKIRFILWFLVGFTGVVISTTLSPFILQFITFILSCIVLFWSFT